jgi:prophage tail gpP-like protein
MPVPFTPNTPDREEVQLRIMDEQVTLSRWISYDFASEYLKPASGFHFVVAGDLSARERAALKVGARVRLTINGIPLCDGHIDSVEVSAARGGGVGFAIAGRERLGLAVDAIADPTLQIKESFTLAEALRLLYTPFGWLADDHFSIDNAASRGVTQGLRGTPMTKGGKRKGPRPLKSFVLHQCKPHNHEGVHDFAKRMAERHGLWIRCSEDGERIIVDRPNFTQDPSGQIRRSDNGDTNVIDGTVRFDFSDQPACIIADGFSGGGEFGKGRIKAYGVNPYFGVDEDGFVLDEVTAVLQKHPTAQQVVFTTQPFVRRSVNVPPRIVFLHDEESKTQDELNNFVRREMSLAMRKSLTAHYTAEGHGQIVEGQFVPWMVDTVVDVQDDIAGVNERMWVSSVAYSKSRQAGNGTTTRIDLIRLNTIQLGEDPDTGTTATTTKKAPLNISSSGFVKTNPQPDAHPAASTTVTKR